MVVGSWGANEQCAAPSVGEHRANHHWPGVRIHAGKFVEDNKIQADATQRVGAVSAVQFDHRPVG